VDCDRRWQLVAVNTDDRAPFGKERAPLFIQRKPLREVKETFETDSLPFKFSHTQASIRQGSPPLGADNHYVFAEILGMSEEEITELAEQAVF